MTRTRVFLLTSTILNCVAGYCVGQEPAKPGNAITNSIGMKLTLIPAGEFMMGSPETEFGHEANEKSHKVHITKPFYIGIYDVTQAEYEQVMKHNPSYYSSSGEGKDAVSGTSTSRFPVESVTWNHAQEFCRRLSQQEGKTYRLPTEAEWEYACRACSTTKYYYGDDPKQLSQVAHYTHKLSETAPKDASNKVRLITEVGTLLPNSFGLYDMHGLPRQWCQDWYDENYYSASALDDPQGPQSGTLRVVRGGKWFMIAEECGTAARNQTSPEIRSESTSFRVVCEYAAATQSVAVAPQPANVQPKETTIGTQSSAALSSSVKQAATFSNSIGMKLTEIPAGEFMMGSANSDPAHRDDETLHRVQLTKTIYMGTCEVTLGQFLKFYNEAKYKCQAESSDVGGGTGYTGESGHMVPFKISSQYVPWSWGFSGQTMNHPVVNVSWNDAVAFCAWLSKNEGKTYRLPTEAEWEYAARAGTVTHFYSGDSLDGLSQVANVLDESLQEQNPSFYGNILGIRGRDGYPFTAPVGRFRPNAFGLYDMMGNAMEWCQDWYDKDYYSASPVADPQGPASGTTRVIRGGSWCSHVMFCRCASRFSTGDPHLCKYDLGFRVVCEAR